MRVKGSKFTIYIFMVKHKQLIMHFSFARKHSWRATEMKVNVREPTVRKCTSSAETKIQQNPGGTDQFPPKK